MGTDPSVGDPSTHSRTAPPGMLPADTSKHPHPCPLGREGLVGYMPWGRGEGHPALGQVDTGVQSWLRAPCPDEELSQLQSWKGDWPRPSSLGHHCSTSASAQPWDLIPSQVFLVHSLKHSLRADLQPRLVPRGTQPKTPPPALTSQERCSMAWFAGGGFRCCMMGGRGE